MSRLSVAFNLIKLKIKTILDLVVASLQKKVINYKLECDVCGEVGLWAEGAK